MISVIIPVYNTAKYLRQAVLSALDQAETGEVIIVDDGSTDDSLLVARNLAGEFAKVRVLRHPDRLNHGAGASRNLGIRRAKFDLIAFLDADDLYLDDRFGETVKILAKHPEIDGVYGTTKAVFMNEELEKWWIANRGSIYTTVRKVVHPNNLFEEV